MGLTPPYGRALDWFCTAMVLTWGLTLAIPGNTFALSGGYTFMAELMPKPVWAFVLILTGAVRAAALIVNGSRPNGTPALRAAGAGVGVVVWLLLLAGFLDLSIATQSVSAGVGVNLVLLGADTFNCARAGGDAVRARRGAHAGLHRG